MFIIKYRIPIIIIVLGITVFLGIGLTKMTKENGVKALLATDNKDYLFFEEMEDVFGATDQLVLGVTFHDSVYKKENLKLIQELTKYFEENENIKNDDIVSLSNIDNIEGLDEELIIAPIIPEDEEITNSIAESIKIKVRDNDMLNGKIVSLDEKSTVIIITINSDISFNAEKLDSVMNFVKDKIAVVEKSRPDVNIYRSGMVSVKYTTSEYMDRDMKFMFPIAIGVVAIILLILLRSISGVIMPMLVTLFSVIWTLGLKGWLNSPLTLAETVIPIMLIAIGCADGVHIVSEYLFFSRSGLHSREALAKTMKNLRTPIILTSITTALSFFSLILAPGVSVKNMGIFLGFGVVVAMFFSLTLVPILLSFKKDNNSKKIENRKKIDLTSIAELIIHKKIVIVIISILFLGVSIIGMKNIVVETDQIMFLKDNDPLKISTKKIQENLGGINTLDIIIEGDEDSLKSPETLIFMNKLQIYADNLKSVSYSISLVDYLKKINYEFMGKDIKYKTIPEKQGVISNLLFLYEMGGGDSLHKVVNSDYSLGKISIRLLDTTQLSIEKIVDDLDLWINENKPKNLTTSYTNDYIRIVMGDLITKGQVRSFISTLIAVLFLLMIIFRSPISGLLVAIPVIIAVCFNFAIMWLTGTTLNIGTSIIASVGMGVGIDYSIHFFQRYKTYYLTNNDNNLSITLAFNESVKPIISNALAVGLGFLTLMLSNYYIIAGIGWITGLSMLTTAFCALVVLPAYLSIFEPLKKRKGKSMKKSLIAVFILLSSSIFANNDGFEIMKKNDELKNSSDSSNITTMVLIDKRGNKKIRKMEIYSVDTEKGDNQFIHFLLPSDVKGIKFLTLGDYNNDDEQRLFLPALGKIRKISSSNKNGKFVGSDITFYDMDSKNFNEFNYEYLKDDIVRDIDCWVVTSMAIENNAPYFKVNNYVSKSDYYIYKKEMFDQKDKLIKSITVLETKTIDGVIIPIKTIIENFDKNHKTLLSVEDVYINTSLDKNIFSIQNLN